jgi:hypothetical protein
MEAMGVERTSVLPYLGVSVWRGLFSPKATPLFFLQLQHAHPLERSDHSLYREQGPCRTREFESDVTFQGQLDRSRLIAVLYLGLTSGPRMTHGGRSPQAGGETPTGKDDEARAAHQGAGTDPIQGNMGGPLF